MPTDFATWFVIGAALALGAGLMTIGWCLLVIFLSWIVGAFQ